MIAELIPVLEYSAYFRFSIILILSEYIQIFIIFIFY
jgi:hypothetical protein